MADNQFVFDFLVGKDEVSQKFEKSQTTLRGFGETVDRMGRQSMIAMRSLGEAGQLAGLNDNLIQATRNAASMTDVIGDLGGAFSAMNPWMIAVAAAGAGVAYVFAQIQAESKKAADEVAKIRQPFEDTRKEIEALAKLRGIDQMAKDLGVSAQALTDFVKSGKEASDTAFILSRSQEEIAVKTKQLTTAQTELTKRQKEYDENKGGALGDSYQMYLDKAKQKVNDLETELRILNVSQKESSDIIKEQAPLIADNSRVQGIYNNAIVQAQAATANYTKQLRTLADAHAKAQASATADIIKARDATYDKQIEIENDLAERIGEIEDNALENRTESYRNYEQNIKELNKDIAKNQRDLAKELEQINRDALNDELTAKTWADVQMIRRKAQQAREQKIQDKGEAQETFADRRQKMNEEYRHSEELRNRDLEKSILAAQKQADKQIQQAWKSYIGQRDAILQRSADEEAAYAKSRADAYSNYTEQMRQLFDTRTEVEKQRDAYKDIGTTIDANTKKLIDFKAVSDSISPDIKISGTYANGGRAQSSLENRYISEW